MRMACHATTRGGLLSDHSRNERLLWQCVQLTPSACDACIIIAYTDSASLMERRVARRQGGGAHDARDLVVEQVPAVRIVR